MAYKTWAPNERLTASDLNGNFNALVNRQVQRGSGSLTLGTSYADVTGLTLTAPAGDFLVLIVCDMSVSSAGAGQCEGVLNVGGADQTATAVYGPATSVTGRATCTQAYYLTGVAAGTTIKVRAKKSVAGGTAACIGTNSAIVIT